MNRRNRLRRAALVLALLVLAAIVTGVAVSATTTAIPEKLIGKWERGNGEVMVVGPRGKVNFSKAGINKAGWYHTTFSHVVVHRLSISGPRSCSGTGRYRWWFAYPDGGFGGDDNGLHFEKIHDACKLRVSLMIETAAAYGPVYDSPPPDIRSISARPATLSPGQSFVVSAHVTSRIGVQAIELQSRLNGSSGVASFCDRHATLTRGTARDGIWSINCTVPDQVLSGDYTITPYAEDVAEDWTNSHGGPTSPTTGTFTVTGGLSDVARPTILSIDVNPSTVSHGQTFTVSAHITSPVGVKAIGLESTQAARQVSGDAFFCAGNPTPTSGTRTDGTWSLHCTVPQVVASGSYIVTPFLEDILGQWVNTNGGPKSPTQGSFTVS